MLQQRKHSFDCSLLAPPPPPPLSPVVHCTPHPGCPHGFTVLFSTQQRIKICKRYWLQLGSVSSRCSGMSPCSPPERRLGALGWALVTDVSSQMYIFTSRRLTAIHAVVHQVWQILCNEETLSRSLILSRVISGYCGSLCSNLEQI